MSMQDARQGINVISTSLLILQVIG